MLVACWLVDFSRVNASRWRATKAARGRAQRRNCCWYLRCIVCACCAFVAAVAAACYKNSDLLSKPTTNWPECRRLCCQVRTAAAFGLLCALPSVISLLLAVTVLIVALSSAWATTTPTTPGLVQLLPILPPDLPVCRLPAVCAARSPRVCGRTEMGMCRRFNNVCELLELIAWDQARRSPRIWTHTQPRDCRRVRGVGASHAYWCHEECPSQPAICPRSRPEQEICVRSRDHQICKVVANRCQLLNNNCFATPRQGK